MYTQFDSQGFFEAARAFADLSIAVDDQALVTLFHFNDPEVVGYSEPDWTGRFLRETLDIASQSPAEELLVAAKAQPGIPIKRDLVHLLDDGVRLPVSYVCLAASDGTAVLVGWDLRPQEVVRQQLINAQQVLERDYWRIRDLETRYRLLFDMSADGFIVLDAGSRRVLETNIVADGLLANAGKTIIGKPFPVGFTDKSASSIESALGVALVNGLAELSEVNLLKGDAPFSLSVRLLRQGVGDRFLVRLSSNHVGVSRESASSELIDSALMGSPEAVLIIDNRGFVRDANNAFARLAELPSPMVSIDRRADEWIGPSGVDLNVLLSNLEQRGLVACYTTSMKGAMGARENIEISASEFRHGEEKLYILLIRDLGRRIAPVKSVTVSDASSLESIKARVGRIPLKDLVRESTDVIEKLCIESALEMTGDNRVSAADMLGLSRQSLYSKMRRFEIGGLSESDDA